MDKVLTYIGFAIKSNGIVYGCDNIMAKSRKCKLVLVSDRLASGSLDKLKNKVNCEILTLPGLQFSEMFNSALAVAITNSSLSEAIKQNIN